MAPGFAFHDLPEDIVRCLLTDWMESLRTMSILDISYCNFTLRPVFLACMRGASVVVDESKLGINFRRVFYQWMIDRAVKMDSLCIDQTGPSAKLSRRERMPPQQLLLHVRHVVVAITSMKSVEHPTISALLDAVPCCQSIELKCTANNDDCLPALTSKQRSLLSRVTKLDTDVDLPTLLTEMQRMNTTLHELQMFGITILHISKDLWKCGMFDSLQKLCIHRMCPMCSWKADVGDVRDVAHLPQLTRLTLSFAGVLDGHAISNYFRFLTRGAPRLSHLDLLDVGDWTEEMDHELFVRTIPTLTSLHFRNDAMELHANAKSPFTKLETFESSDDPEWNIVALIMSGAEVQIELDIYTVFSDLIDTLPWNALSAGQLTTLQVVISDFSFDVESFLVMIMAPSRQLWVKFDYPVEDDYDMDDEVRFLCDFQQWSKLGHISTVTDLMWMISSDRTDMEDVELSELSTTLLAVTSLVFTNTVHLKCTLPSFEGVDFANIVSQLSRLRKMTCAHCPDLVLQDIAANDWQKMLSQTGCRTYLLVDCKEIEMKDITVLCQELQKETTKVKDWTVNFTIHPMNRTLWTAKPRCVSKDGLVNLSSLQLTECPCCL